MKSFIHIAPDSDFTLHTLPYGVFRPKNEAHFRVGVAVGERVLDLSLLDSAGLLPTAPGASLFFKESLNAFMATPPRTWQMIRATLQNLLNAETPTLQNNTALCEQAFFHQSDVELKLPIEIGDYTDFYSSEQHARNMGKMFRDPDNPLTPNWKSMPIAYHGRTSSFVTHGASLIRPLGQIKKGEEPPFLGPTEQFDFELEMAFIIGKGNRLGEPIATQDAFEHIFGLALLNDWSARDIQRFESAPLGPFLGKNFATSLSPWVVPLEALMPFLCEGEKQDPPVLSYLQETAPAHFDIELEVAIKTQKSEAFFPLCHSNFKYVYWSMRQQLAHHTINGCNVRTGDVMASGTISGSKPDSFGSMLELAWRGEKPITLPNGEKRTFLEDGDSVRLKAWAVKGEKRIGFGELINTILPARS